MSNFTGILTAVLHLNKAAAMYDPNEVRQREAEADRKALLEAQKIPSQRDRELQRARLEESEASLRSTQQNPELSQWMTQRKSYEDAVKRGYGHPFSKNEYDSLGKRIASEQTRLNNTFSSAVEAAKEPVKVTPPKVPSLGG